MNNKLKFLQLILIFLTAIGFSDLTIAGKSSKNDFQIYIENLKTSDKTQLLKAQFNLIKAVNPKVIEIMKDISAKIGANNQNSSLKTQYDQYQKLISLHERLNEGLAAFNNDLDITFFNLRLHVAAIMNTLGIILTYEETNGNNIEEIQILFDAIENIPIG